MRDTNNKVIIKKVIRADRERVFDAWTKPEIMQHWFVGRKGRAITSNELKVGGRYTNEMLLEDSGCSSTSTENRMKTKSFMHNGEYLEIVRPERLVFTWNSPAVENSKVIIELRDLGGATEVTLTHELFSEQQCESHAEGWNFALSGLAALLNK